MNTNSPTSGRLLARNTLWNLVGQGAPLVAAVVALPPIIRGLGIDRYGVLSLVWMFVGYFSFLDLGLGRVLTKLLAEQLGRVSGEALAKEIWTAWSLILGLGLVGAVVIAAIAPWLVYRVLKIPPELQAETLQTIYLLAGTLPLVVSSAGLAAILAAQQRFGLLNAVAIPQGVCSILGPLLVLPFSHSIFAVALTLTAVRLAAWLAYLLLCFRVMPAIARVVALERSAVMPLIRFGSWMTVSNVVGPVMVYMDRFLVGALVSTTAIAYYATPYDVATKLLIIPGALVAVLFPAFSSSITNDRIRAARLFGRGTTYTMLALFPLSLLIVTLAQPLLTLWLGATFAQQSTRVLQWLTIGVFLNGLAQFPFALLQAAGRPDLTAKLHLVELPCYCLVVFILIRTYGIEGAAIAWFGRVLVDTIALFLMARRLLADRSKSLLAPSVGAVTTLAVLALAAFPAGNATKGLFLLVTLPGFAVVAWISVLNGTERAVARKWVGLRDSS
jgi:O-antigen/teichoic acid export membrane protein